MKNISKILILFFSLGVLSSCEQDLNVNTDPTAPGSISPDLAIASAEASLIAINGGDFNNLGGFYAQYYTQAPSAGQYDGIDQYNLSTGFGNLSWNELYAGCLNDLNFVITESKKQGNTGKVLIAELLKAYTYQLLVDIYGDVPYTEALQGVGNINPKPTSGKEVYLDLIKKIDQAVATYKSNPVASDFRKQEPIYKGDMTNWIKFANTLKLRLYIRMAYTADANPAAVLALLAENNFITTDAAFSIFGTDLATTNPFYAVNLSTAGTGLGDINHIASSSLFQFYDQNDDPRLKAVYRPNTTGAYVALAQGAGELFTNTAINYSRPNITATTPAYLITVAESNFLQAEAMIRYAGGSGAKAQYDLGVQNSFLTYKLPVAGAIALTSAGGAYEYITGLGVEASVRQVIIQKWAALANVNNIEAYIESTRTKYPEVVSETGIDYSKGQRIVSKTSILTSNAIPSILFYPSNETERNPNVKQRASITEKVWWDQKQQ
jgi:hypothetical protein